MLCDDDPGITAVLKEGLNDAGFTVDTFNDAKAALSEFRKGKYSVIILDEIMPGMDGIALYQLVRRNDPGVRIFFVTSYETAVKRALPDLQDDFILEKPVSVKHLIHIMKEATGRL